MKYWYKLLSYIRVVPYAMLCSYGAYQDTPPPSHDPHPRKQPKSESLQKKVVLKCVCFGRGANHKNENMNNENLRWPNPFKQVAWTHVGL